MRAEPLPSCERNTIIESFSLNTRLDERKCDEFRETKIIVGRDFGSCIAMIGQSKVSAQVSCSLIEPSPTRGTMGSVEIYIDMSPIARPEYEEGRLGSKGSQMMQILRLLYRDCGILDLESLCLASYKQVWQIRVDVHVLDADGALIDCASLASLTALSHFRIPDVTVLQDATLIHSYDEKVPVALSMYHMPVCVTFGVTPDSQRVVVDPSEKEGQCLGLLVVAANKRREVCAIHQIGSLCLSEQLIMSCVNITIQRAVDVSELIRSVIVDDNLKRSQRKDINGFEKMSSLGVYSSHEYEPNELIAPALKTDPFKVNHPLVDDVTEDQMHIGEIASEKAESDSDSSLVEQALQIAANSSGDSASAKETAVS